MEMIGYQQNVLFFFRPHPICFVVMLIKRYVGGSDEVFQDQICPSELAPESFLIGESRK